MCYAEYLIFFLTSDDAEPGIITTALIVQIIDKRSFNAVGEYYANKAYASWEDRMLLFDNFTAPPGAVMCMAD